MLILRLRFLIRCSKGCCFVEYHNICFCCVADMIGRVGKVVEAYEFVKGLGEDGNTMEIRGSLLGAYKNLRIEL